MVCQRRGLTKKEKEENIWRRKISGQRRRIGVAGKCSDKKVFLNADEQGGGYFLNLS